MLFFEKHVRTSNLYIYFAFMEKNWIIKPPCNTETVQNLAKELGISKSLANLLVHRNITTFAQAKSFFRPSLNDLHDPFLMKGMNKAVNRLNTAIKNSEKILIYGDYDVDGTTSVALVYSYLSKYHGLIDYYVPDRYEEGYGISYKSIDYANEKDCTLIIALDCGIKANDKIDYATSKGIDYIICDHHLPGKEIPKAIAVLDPKQEDCNYPYKGLSGCGVGFKLMQAFSVVNNIPSTEIYDFLDLVAISIASDIVPITGENRVLAYYGLKKLNTNATQGVRALRDVSDSLKTEITISDIVFKLGPRINAAGRIDTAKNAVALLVTKNYTDAENLAKKINAINIERQEIDHNITIEALNLIESSEELKHKKTTVLYNHNWSKGVIGIVASRLTEHYYRPTIILTKSGEGLISGSARSVIGYNLYEAIDSCSHLLEGFGGHMYAAGLTFKEENLEKFTDCFENYVAKTITEEQLSPQIIIDGIIKLSEIDDKFYKILNQFAPFGPENMTPVFVSRDVVDSGSSKIVGKDNSHLKLSLKQENTILNGIAFGMANKYEIIQQKEPFDVCFNIDENNFMNRTSLQLSIRDIKKD